MHYEKLKPKLYPYLESMAPIITTPSPAQDMLQEDTDKNNDFDPFDSEDDPRDLEEEDDVGSIHLGATEKKGTTKKGTTKKGTTKGGTKKGTTKKSGSTKKSGGSTKKKEIGRAHV